MPRLSARESEDVSLETTSSAVIDAARGVPLAQTRRVGRRLVKLGFGLLLATGASAWILATEHRETGLATVAIPRPEPTWPMSAARSAPMRDDALRRSRVRLRPPGPPTLDLDVVEPPLACRFLAELPTGTSPKFDCVLDDGEVVKVKYGRNPEVPAEVAATRLIASLGYPADRMSLTPRVRCVGCPRYPFFSMRLLQLTGLHSRFPTYGRDDGASDFEWAAVERKFDAAAIELPDRQGWAWWEIAAIDPVAGASREDLDALRLLAVFLAHWDNKSENQRLVCLDPPAASDSRCERPLAMLQDLGATFGPPKANLARWRSMPIWSDRATCLLSMERLPFGGATFPETRIGEAGRRQLAEQLSALSDEDLRSLFRTARFPEYYSGTNDDKDLDAWTEAFKWRVSQIASAGPCSP
jgi:hypothetical protein